MDFSKIREDYFPVTKDFVFLDIANHSPPCVPVQEAIRGYLRDWDRLDRQGDHRVDETIALWAKLVGCSPDEACFQPNTSAGLATADEAIPFENGENIVVNDLENPANLYPWLAQRPKGVEITGLSEPSHPRRRDAGVEAGDVPFREGLHVSAGAVRVRPTA